MHFSSAVVLQSLPNVCTTTGPSARRGAEFNLTWSTFDATHSACDLESELLPLSPVGKHSGWCHVGSCSWSSHLTFDWVSSADPEVPRSPSPLYSRGAREQALETKSNQGQSQKQQVHNCELSITAEWNRYRTEQKFLTVCLFKVTNVMSSLSTKVLSPNCGF